MNVFLVRHGEAEDKKVGQNDAERALTAKGIKELHTAAKHWKGFIPGFDFLIASQLKRAIETAQVVKEVFEFKDDVIHDKRLNPGSRSKDIIDMLNELSGENIAIFGHEPDFSEHVSAFISSTGAIIDFKKGAIAKVSFPAKARLSGGALQYLIPPKAFLK